MSILLEILILLKDVAVSYAVAILRFFISPPRKSLKDEIVLITGAASGMGRQLALEFAKHDCILILWDVEEEGNESTAQAVRDQGGTAHAYTCDLRIGCHLHFRNCGLDYIPETPALWKLVKYMHGDLMKHPERETIYKVAERVRIEVGDVTMLINNAGAVTGKPLLKSPDSMIERTFQVNILAHFWTVKCFLPSMLENNHGHIVSIASSLGLLGINKLTDYCSSKFAVVGFTEVLNYEIKYMGHTGVHTTVICPSYVNTGMFEGCQMRFPQITPPLEIQPTVDKIMKAILTNQCQVCIPRLIYFCVFLKALLPTDAMLTIMKFFGSMSFMDTYVGRKQK